MQDFDIIEGLDNMQMDAVMALLKTTHWASHRSEQQERRSRNILLPRYTLLKNGREIAFARVVSKSVVSRPAGHFGKP